MPRALEGHGSDPVNRKAGGLEPQLTGVAGVDTTANPYMGPLRQDLGSCQRKTLQVCSALEESASAPQDIKGVLSPPKTTTEPSKTA